MGEPRTLAFGVLGTLQIRRGSTPVVVDSRTQRTVLARLIVQDGPVGEDALVDAVWRGRPPASAVSSLRSHISRLRGTLSAGSSDAVVVHGHGGYRLVGPATVDTVAFEQFVVAAAADRAAGDRHRARERLSAGLALWRGEALAEFRYEPFAQAAVARLEALRLQATEDQLEVAIDLGAAAEVVPELQALAVAHPLRERLHALLMLALYRCGRQADALAAYQRAGRTHVDELGVDPPPLLQHLHRDILRQDERLLRPEVVGQVSLQPAPEVSLSTTSWRELTAAVELPPLSAEVRGELLVARGRALPRAGRLEDSHLAYAAAVRLANDAGDAEDLAVAALGLAGPPEDTHTGEAHDEALLERALLGLAADAAVGAQLRARLAVALLDRGDARGHELLGSATDAARTNGDPAALAYALRSRHRSWFDPSQLPARRELADELLRIGVRSGDHQIEAWGHRWRAIDLIEAGEIDDALAALDALEELVETEPEAFHRWAVLVRRAGCRLLREPVQKSETAVLEALALTDEMRSELTTLAASMLLVTLRFMQGTHR